MFSSYLPDDVTILLTDVSSLVTPMDVAEREALIQKGAHYSEMLPIEYEPTSEYMALYEEAVERYAPLTAQAVGCTARAIVRDKGRGVVLVSLARAGTSVGVLLRRYLRTMYGIDAPHYTLSIIRGRGIDENAMAYILKRHAPQTLQFVDGWTGKGAIARELIDAMKAYPKVDARLAVLSDPADIAPLRGTQDDFLIASACLNSTVSGLLSRTFYRKDIIKPDEFHGAIFYQCHAPHDVTYDFINAVAAHFPAPDALPPEMEAQTPQNAGIAEAREIQEKFGVEDFNFIKPGIGEATRVLLRRVPWKILVRSLDDDAHLAHLYRLAKEKGVTVEEYPLRRYRACGIIRAMRDV